MKRQRDRDVTDRDERNEEIKRRTEGGREGQGWL